MSREGSTKRQGEFITLDSIIRITHQGSSKVRGKGKSCTYTGTFTLGNGVAGTYESTFIGCDEWVYMYAGNDAGSPDRMCVGACMN